MSEVSVLELRVLCGPQAGCCLPLAGGMYRAGGDECCDVILEGIPSDQSAFVIYVGQRAVALESLIEGVRIDGRPARGLRELRPGQVFELGQWLFAVDEPDAPWPKDPELLRRSERADEGAGTAASAPEEPAEAQSKAPSADERTATPTDGGAGGEPPRADRADAEAGSPAPSVPPRARRGPPFWVIGLGGTAAFLGAGVLVLVLSLAPSQPASAPDPAHTALALGRMVSSAGGESDVKLDHLPGGRLRLSGHVGTRLQRMNLIRSARSIDPSVQVEISADEDIEALARDTLTRFPDTDVELAGVHLGRVTLKGRVATGTLRDEIVAALRDEVPGMSAVDDQIIANDDILTALNVLLARAGLAGRITGHLDRSDSHLIVEGALDEGDGKTWLGVRRELAARFGPSLTIVEDFSVPAGPAAPGRSSRVAARHGAAPRGDVVAAVMGPMPYVVLSSGQKLATSAVARAR